MALGSAKRSDPPAVGADGFFHPASEQDLVSLVQMAAAQKRLCRVRGAAHSVSHAIYAGPLHDVPNRVNWQTPPRGDGVEIMLDRYRRWWVKDASRKLVEVEAGIHLGADPNDPTGPVPPEGGLLWQLWNEHGWTLSNLGGITRQTVSGFTATGSSGGSVQYSVNDNLWGFRVIDASGAAHELSCEDKDPDLFYAMSPNLGLLGIVSTIIFKCEDSFNISGQEAITTIEDCAIDLFGPGSAERPSLEAFLRDAEYARLEWWPQRGAERVQVWQAQRIDPQLGFLPHRYEEFKAHPTRTQVFASILLTLLGNLDDLAHARVQIRHTFEHLGQLLADLPAFKRLGRLGQALAKFLSVGSRQLVDLAIVILKPFARILDRKLPAIFPRLLGIFIKLDADKPGIKQGEPQSFRDHSWQGLPMDNGVDDLFMPTAFTEMWVPLTRTQQVMRLLLEYFEEPLADRESYRRTGLYAWELYTAKPTRFWMSPSHTNGQDEWKDGAFRIDPYWFQANPGNAAQIFFPQFWDLLARNQVPFRLHWGKYQPVVERGDTRWVEHFKGMYPRWDHFMSLRTARDPGEIFLTSYWRERFGLSAPVAAPSRAPSS